MRGFLFRGSRFSRMRHAKEEPSCSAAQAIDLISAVKELHGLSSQELTKLLRDSENFTIHYHTEKGSLIKIDMDKLAAILPLHLLGVLMSSDRDEALFEYMLRGIRLLHSLCDLAPRHAKVEQILLDDVKVLEQLLDLVFYLLIILGGYRQENHNFGNIPLSLMHSALLTSSLYLLPGCISSQWQDLVHVLLAHPKVDMFMDAAFGAVRTAVGFLEIKLSAHHADFCTNSNLTAEQVVNYLCLQCEASLQFLQSLCQQKMFRERLLRNKELCGKGGVLFLARAILKLDVPPLMGSSRFVAALSRMKAKVLSILLSLCEAESISYLDEVASSPESLNLAKSVALEVLGLLKTALGRDPEHLASSSGRSYPMGFLQLNAMRLADIFSDDSNFRSYVTIHFTKVLTAIFSLPQGDFLSSWCSSNLPLREEDASVEYDSFTAAGWLLDKRSSLGLPNGTNLEFTLNPNSMPQGSYEHQRTSLFVKVIANLHCFVPNICEEQERNLFLLNFLECLQIDLSKSLPGFSFNPDAPKAATVCENLRSLLSHAESLIPNFLNEEDVQLLRVFFNQLQSVITSGELEENRVQDNKFEESTSWDKFSKFNIGENHQEAQSTGGFSSPFPRKEPPRSNNRRSNLKEEMSENSAFQEVEHFYVKSDHRDQGDYVMRQSRREDKGISGKRASGGLREIDRDVQNVETSGSDTSSSRGKNATDQKENGEFSKFKKQIKEGGFGGKPEDEMVIMVQCEEKQRKKRKRTIMNDKQITLMERALLDEPDMQRNAASIQLWADKLSPYGSEVTSSQLKNWLNNRKARLARSAKDAHATSDIDSALPDKQGGPGAVPGDLPVPGEDAIVPSNERRDPQSMSRTGSGEKTESSLAEFVDIGPAEFVERRPGQYVVLEGVKGEEIAKGKVHQVHGKWYGTILEHLQMCVVDVTELKAERGAKLPYPSEIAGTTFDEAETKLGVMRVLWGNEYIVGC
ncbi:nodulin homeobox-like isoform X2 [Corylus avellana]|uniref:nodulin homeobox-like isoform X2 n=1 Tax=Corylus avellana TaxID=13451 RepID=UPI00286C3ED9|nr:nodulin homeobox-like isoform X2 [Corylus avellana]